MEYIKVNDILYECKSIITGIDSISFTMEGQNVTEIQEVFKGVTSLTVQPNNEESTKPYGYYENLSFVSAAVYADESVCVVMHIKSDIEIRLDNIEASQEIQDEAIAEVAELVATGAEDIEEIKETNDIQDEAIVELADVVAGGE